MASWYLSGLQMLRDIATPAPLVFGFVEVVLTVCSVAIVAHNRYQFIIEISDQYAIFLQPPILRPFHQC
jgi:hypothetical protein